MVKYFSVYLFLYSGLIWGQFSNPVLMSLETESSGRAGGGIRVHVDALVDDQWKI